jgi:hemin uptake protein HemP
MPGDSKKPHISELLNPTSGESGVVRELRFEELSGGQSELIVEYGGQKYRLIATKNGRLVLNK